jgi:hypothetical protein
MEEGRKRKSDLLSCGFLFTFMVAELRRWATHRGNGEKLDQKSAFTRPPHRAGDTAVTVYGLLY